MLKITLFLRVFEKNDIFNFRQNSRCGLKISIGVPDKCVLCFMQKFKMATKKWRESGFCKMSPVHSTNNLPVQIFFEIALSRTVSKINALLCFTQKFKMAAKSGGKAIFAKKSPVDSADPAGQKFR